MCSICADDGVGCGVRAISLLLVVVVWGQHCGGGAAAFGATTSML
jgi:hypothetical protein